MCRKDFVSDWRAGEGVTGYVAVMEWSRVQLERPRASTSGGQSLSDVGGATTAAAVGLEVWPFAMDVHALKAGPEVQERHL